MYGALTGKSKQMIANEYGDAQLKKWRRGFKIRPPAVSSYSFNYPGNDYKRTKYVRDIPISLRETINRSIEARKFQIHRKFPKTESLWDCVSVLLPHIQQVALVTLLISSYHQLADAEVYPILHSTHCPRSSKQGQTRAGN